MKPADDPSRDYRALVRDGYDRCVDEFNAARARESADVLAPLIERLAPGACVLDLGCGGGVPIASTLARSCHVTGVDISRAQIERARAQVPAATFIRSDMTSCRFDAGSFDAVVSLYALFHVPREEHRRLIGDIHSWLAPGGYLMASFATHDEPAYTEEFFGVEMFWSNYGLDEYVRMIEECGFELLEQHALSHGYADADHPPESHPLLLAQRR